MQPATTKYGKIIIASVLVTVLLVSVLLVHFRPPIVNIGPEEKEPEVVVEVAREGLSSAETTEATVVETVPADTLVCLCHM